MENTDLCALKFRKEQHILTVATGWRISPQLLDGTSDCNFLKLTFGLRDLALASVIAPVRRKMPCCRSENESISTVVLTELQPAICILHRQAVFPSRGNDWDRLYATGATGLYYPLIDHGIRERVSCRVQGACKSSLYYDLFHFFIDHAACPIAPVPSMDWPVHCNMTAETE
jgi:hypothetical protein